MCQTKPRIILHLHNPEERMNEEEEYEQAFNKRYGPKKRKRLDTQYPGIRQAALAVVSILYHACFPADDYFPLYPHGRHRNRLHQL